MDKKTEDMKIPTFKRPKEANAISVGGMIAFGKTTLITGLQDHYKGSNVVFELNDRDKVQSALLQSMYEGNRTQSAATFQVDFLLTRILNYENGLKNESKTWTLFDRTIFEDLLFAHQNMAGEPQRYRFYMQLWETEVKRMVYTLGVPKLYLLLNAPWETFKERLFARNRSAEVNNWEKNEMYFKELHNRYIPFMKRILEEYGVSYIILDATKSPDQVLFDAISHIEKI